MSNKVLILIFIVGLGLGWAGAVGYNKTLIDRYENQIKKLEEVTKDLKAKLSQLENKEDDIKKEVEREQANKTTEQILKYWNSAYSSSKSTKRSASL